MLDNDLIELIITTMISQEAVAGIPNTPIAQAFQPTQQGANSTPTAYIHKVFDYRLGSPKRSDVWDPEKKQIIHTDCQLIETTFQVSTLATQNPKEPDQLTASDFLNLFAYILQTNETIEAFQEKTVAIQKIGQVQNPYFRDDRARNEASPLLDFIVTHKQIVTRTSPVLQSTEFQILKV